MSRDPLWKGANCSYRETLQGVPLGKQYGRVTAGTRMEACFPWLLVPTPHQSAGVAHPVVTPVQLATDTLSQTDFFPVSLFSEDVWKTERG